VVEAAAAVGLRSPLSMGEQRSSSRVGRSAGLLPATCGPSGGESERRAGDAVEALAAVGAEWGKCRSLSFFFRNRVYAVWGGRLWAGPQAQLEASVRMDARRTPALEH
jgi:hypothetical protein